MGWNSRLFGDNGPTWLIWWLFWAAVLFWPTIVWHGAAAWWATAGWLVFFGSLSLGWHALKKHYEPRLKERGPSFTCPVCGAVSYHPGDIASGYCGRCHDFTGRR